MDYSRNSAVSSKFRCGDLRVPCQNEIGSARPGAGGRRDVNRLVRHKDSPSEIASSPPSCSGPSEQAVDGAADRRRSPIQDVGVVHCGAQVLVTEELLDGADIVAVLEGRRQPNGTMCDSYA
jgi:hypothetical protein